MPSLVTGGTGYLGGAIVGALLARGEQVRVLARTPAKTAALRERGVEVVGGDILDPEQVAAAIEGCETLYHAAAIYQLWGVPEAELRRAAVDGTRTVLEAARAAGVHRVVYTSTSVAIGELPGEVGTEATPHSGVFPSRYGRAKYEAEQVAAGYAAAGLPVVIVNPAAVYGPGDLKSIGPFLIDLVNGALPGVPNGALSLVFLDDAATGHLLAAEKGRVGERYLLAEQWLTPGELAAAVAQLAGVKRPPVLPGAFWSLVTLVGETVSRLSGKRPLIARDEYRLLAYGNRVDGSRATRELGLAYTPLEEGLRRALQWYWEHGHLKRRPACLDA